MNRLRSIDKLYLVAGIGIVILWVILLTLLF
jgi:hypothetical protein